MFLALPGLNLTPSKLDPLCRELVGLGHAVARPRLRGYARPGDPAWAEISAAAWLADLDAAHAALAARYPKAARSLLGYSNGGLLGLTWSLWRGVPLRRAVLISPAFRLKPYAMPLLTLLGALLPGRTRIPSRSPPAYAMHPYTTLAAYGALVELVRRFRVLAPRAARGEGEPLPPQFIAYAPRDELLRTTYYSLYRALAPERIVLHTLAHTPRPGFPRHLGIDADTLGGQEWAALQRALAEWLAE